MQPGAVRVVGRIVVQKHCALSFAFTRFQRSRKLDSTFSPVISIRQMTTAQQEYRLQESPELKNGQKVTVQVEGIEGGSVLLMKVNDQLRATGPKCTRSLPLICIYFYQMNAYLK